MTTYICNCCNKEIPVSPIYKRKLQKSNPEKICLSCSKRNKKEQYLKFWEVSDSGRKCKTCLLFKPWEEYGERTTKRGQEERVHCLDCRKENAKSNWYNNKEVFQKTHRKNYIKRKYGITEEVYLEMYKTQDGKCAICNTPHDVLCIDHDHKDSAVRALLCRRCNIGIGMFKECATALSNAIKYLESFTDASKNKE